MIKGFTHKGLESFFCTGNKKGIQPAHVRRLQTLLDRLDAAVDVRDMDFPGSRLHEWAGKGKGIWSVDVSGPWRLTFRFQDGHALDVDYVQPH
jgi:proteic killer suppression protein